MPTITLHTDRVIGKIKPVHGVGQPPFDGGDFSMMHYLTEAGIPFSRLHDVGGAYGKYRYVDVPNIFRDFDADANDPAAYDFAFTDVLLQHLIDAGVEPFFRLGVTIENDALVRAYRIYPPKDFHKWAVICEHIIRHYTEGWANGYRWPLRYFEIWNEPENGPENSAENQMWIGTDLQYYELYTVAAKHLKQCFPHLKIGGYASCGFYALLGSDKNEPVDARSQHFMDFYHGFLDYVKKEDAPLDFFSWHIYPGSAGDVRVFAEYARKTLDEAGFTDTETTCNEWNCGVWLRGTPRHAALTAATFSCLQSAPVDSAMFYDARYGISIYGSLFNPLTALPFATYYSFVAFNELYKRQTQVAADSDDADVYVTAAKSDDTALMISNVKEQDVPLTLVTERAPKAVYTVTETGLALRPCPTVLPKNSVWLFVF